MCTTLSEERLYDRTALWSIDPLFKQLHDQTALPLSGITERLYHGRTKAMIEMTLWTHDSVAQRLYYRTAFVERLYNGMALHMVKRLHDRTAL